MTSVDNEVTSKLAKLWPDPADVWEAVSYLTMIYRYGPVASEHTMSRKGAARTTLLQSILVASGLLEPVLEDDRVVRLKISEAGIELAKLVEKGADLDNLPIPETGEEETTK